MEEKITDWGRYSSIEDAPTHTIKRIEVNSGGIYTATHENETLIATILTGKARVTLHNTVNVYLRGQVLRIPQDTQYHIDNPYQKPCVLLAVILNKK